MYTMRGDRIFDTKEGKQAAQVAINQTGLTASRRVVAFDIVKRDELTEKEKAKRGLDAKAKAYLYDRVTNRDLFEGIDSAFKAALYWNKISDTSFHYAILRIPLLVTSKTWLEVSLDGGTPSPHKEGSKGLKTTAYPHQRDGTRPDAITTLICAHSELAQFISGLNQVVEWFLDEQNLTWTT
jgi:hypothetical protein